MRGMAVVVIAAASGAACGNNAAATPDAAAPASDAAPPDAAGGCTADDQCASAACDETSGTCIDEASAIYVISFGGVDATCKKAAPCATVPYAVTQVTATRNFIALGAGAYAGPVVVGVDATISGPTSFPGGAVLIDPSTPVVISTSATDVLANLTVHGANATSIQVTAGDLTLRHVHTGGSPVTAVDVAGGSLHAFDCDITAFNTGFAAAAPLDVTRTIIHSSNYGVRATAPLALSNCMVFGAANTGIVCANAACAIDFSTIVGTGTYAAFLAAGNTVTSSIIDGKVIGTGAYSYSLFTGTPAAGTGNLMGDPAFVSKANADYHLGPTSAAIDQADPAATLDVDFEGGHRPTGPGPDIGADERP